MLALAMLGACRDVPVDPDTATVIPKDEDTTHTPPRDSCQDCVAGHKRPSVRQMTAHYYKGFNKWDSVSINLLDTTQVCAMVVDQRQDGGMNIKLHIEAVIPFLFGSTYDNWGVRDVVINIPEIVVDRQGRCNPVDLRFDPLEHTDKAGISLPYRYAYTGKYGQFYETIKMATGERNRGFFKITSVDPRGRFIDARLEASFDFPDQPFVYQNVFYPQPQPYGTWKKEKVEDVDLSLNFRLALKP
jgi:hypothetical protein